MTQDLLSFMAGDVLEEFSELTLPELCRACGAPAERIFELVDEGLVEPLGQNPAG